MRKTNKYKSFSNFRSDSKKIPLRILSFQRPKWAFFKKKLQKKLQLRYRFFILDKRISKRLFFSHQWEVGKIFFLIFLQVKFLAKSKKKVKTYLPRRNSDVWRRPFVNPTRVNLRKNHFNRCEKLKNYFKDGLRNKQKLLGFYDRLVPAVALQKEMFKSTFIKNVFTSFLVKPYYRVDILLWSLSFYSSAFLARQELRRGHILLNGKAMQRNNFLKKGDVLTLGVSLTDEQVLFFSNRTKKYFPNITIFTFLEIDYFTKTIVILKHVEDLSLNDYCFLVTDSVQLKSLRFAV